MWGTRPVTLALGVFIALGALLAAPGAHATPEVERVSGADRFMTSVAVSRAAFPDAGAVDTVYVASGRTYPDSLSAGPIAALDGAPVLLTPMNSLFEATVSELRRLKPREIIVIGGPGAVSTGVESLLRPLAPTVSRIGGTDRYETSRQVAERGFPDGAETVYLATGRNFADAISGGALAASREAPILLVDTRQPHLDVATERTLSKLGAEKIVVIGGQGVLSSALAQEARAVTGADVKRLGGADRYETSAIVAAEFGAIAEVMLATGTDFPDAISATSLAAARNVPILLTIPYCVSATTGTITKKSNVQKLTMIGGPGAVRGLVGSQHECVSTTNPNSPWVFVNKQHPLRPIDYVPGDLRAVNASNAGGGWMRNEAAGAFERMVATAAKEGAGTIANASAYRSYATQISVYAANARRDGAAKTEMSTARPGYSEHQTGLTVDVVACAKRCRGLDDFGGTTQSNWIIRNAHRFGFIVRYEAGYETITGYQSEPWHLRYVGVTLATDYKSGGFHTLEQYLGYGAAPRY